MKAQKAIKALGEISLVTSRQFPLKVLLYLCQKNEASEEVRKDGLDKEREDQEELLLSGLR